MRRETLNLYLGVGSGAAAGALVRHLVGLGVTAGHLLPAFVATGIVNIVGSFIIVFFAIITGPDGRLLVGPVRRQFVMTGFCGGLTTFSSMSLDSFMLLAGGRPALAGTYLALVVSLSLAAGWAGYVLALRYNR